MCEESLLTNIISSIYLVLCFLIPLLYLLIFGLKNKKKKNYMKAIFLALGIGAILFSIKFVFSLNIGIFNCPNCYINNKCYKEEESDDVNKIDNKKTTTTTTSTTKTTTTTKKIVTEKEYNKVSEITGTRTDVGTSSKGYTIYEIDGVTYIDGYLIANKTYSLPETYVPQDTYSKADGTSTRQCSTCINNTAYNAWKDMKADAAAIGLNIYISSGFRSYITQKNIYNRNVSKNGQAAADTYSARPGSSEHQTALCFDLNTIDSAFGNTEEGKWVAQNAHKYGYIIRYPEGKTNETGYIYEPWHLRYVGTVLAYKLYNNGNWISMEDYFGITSVYSD